jgi:hypothetical protein
LLELQLDSCQAFLDLAPIRYCLFEFALFGEAQSTLDHSSGEALSTAAARFIEGLRPAAECPAIRRGRHR